MARTPSRNNIITRKELIALNKRLKEKYGQGSLYGGFGSIGGSKRKPPKSP